MLNGKRIAILATDGYEQSELTVPLQALREADAEVQVVSLEKRPIRGVEGKQWADEVDAVAAAAGGVFKVHDLLISTYSSPTSGGSPVRRCRSFRASNWTSPPFIDPPDPQNVARSKASGLTPPRWLYCLMALNADEAVIPEDSFSSSFFDLRH